MKTFSPTRACLKVAMVGAAGLALVATGPGVQSSFAGAPKMFLANLNGPQEVPAVASPGHGNAFLTFDLTTKMLCYDVVYGSLVAAEILAHIHGPALPDVSAPPLFTLPLGNPKNGCVGPLTAAQKGDLLKGLYYVNIHSAAFPGGEIRGQIIKVR
jgi:hypothetical protein